MRPHDPHYALELITTEAEPERDGRQTTRPSNTAAAQRLHNAAGTAGTEAEPERDGRQTTKPEDYLANRVGGRALLVAHCAVAANSCGSVERLSGRLGSCPADITAGLSVI